MKLNLNKLPSRNQLWMVRANIIPVYVGNDFYKWLGMKFYAPDAKAGETLFGYWTRIYLGYE